MLEYLRQDEEDDRYLTRREKIARVLTMLPVTIGAPLLVLARSFLPMSTTTTLLLLGAIFVLGAAGVGTVAVRMRRSARRRRRRASKAARRTTPGPRDLDV